MTIRGKREKSRKQEGGKLPRQEEGWGFAFHINGAYKNEKEEKRGEF